MTLCFAQSVDGSIAAPRGGGGGERLMLSGAASMRMTHRLRAWHDGILVGVGTVCADDPSLTVRLCAGASPRPVVVDADLRTPLSCRLLCAPGCRRPILVAARGAARGDAQAKRRRREALEKAGATILELDAKAAAGAQGEAACAGSAGGANVAAIAEEDAPRRGRHVGLGDMLARLGRDYGLERLMVEGGAGIITSFLREQIAGGDVLDAVNVTTAPMFVGGVRAWSGGGGGGSFPRLSSVQYAQAGEDMVMQGLFCAADEAP